MLKAILLRLNLSRDIVVLQSHVLERNWNAFSVLKFANLSTNAKRNYMRFNAKQTNLLQKLKTANHKKVSAKFYC